MSYYHGEPVRFSDPHDEQMYHMTEGTFLDGAPERAGEPSAAWIARADSTTARVAYRHIYSFAEIEGNGFEYTAYRRFRVTVEEVG